MVRYFLLFSLLLAVSGCRHGYSDRYVIFPRITPDSENFVIPDSDKTLVVNVIKSVLIRTQGQSPFDDYTKYISDPDVLALYMHRDLDSYMSVGIYTRKETVIVELGGRNCGRFYVRMKHSIYCDLKDFCEAAKTESSGRNRVLDAKCLEIVSSAPDIFPGKKIQ